MAEMKDSDIRWIGQIPKKWKVIRVKDAFTRKKAKAKQENPVILSLARSGVKVRDITNNEGQLAENYSDYNPVMVDDLLLNPMDLISGDNCNISKIEGVISPAYVNLRYKKGINPEFYNFYFKYQYWCKAFFAYGKGVSFENRWTLNYDILERFPLILPSIEEQNRIEKFLKEKCAEIDALHTDIEKQIETLEEYKKSIITEAVTKGLDPDVEMKDSGIEWVGMIPKHWDVHPVYSYFGERKNRNKLGKETNLLSLSYGNIIRKDINTNGGLLPENFNNYNIVEANDIIIRPTDLQNDKHSLRTGLVTEHGIITSAYIDLYPQKNINSQFFHYLLHTYDLMKVFYNMGNGVRQGLNYSEFSRLMVYFPLPNEQKEIVEYLNTKCAEIDDVIVDKKKQLETLEQYKKSLVYEYVTGKKEVLND